MASFVCTLFFLRHLDKLYYMTNSRWCQQSFYFFFLHIFCLQTALDEAFISVYNLCYTSLPVLALGFFDQDVKPQLTFKVYHTLYHFLHIWSTRQTCLFHFISMHSQHPKLYQPGQLSLFFNYKEFAVSAVQGFVTSMLLFLLPMGKFSLDYFVNLCPP